MDYIPEEERHSRCRRTPRGFSSAPRRVSGSCFQNSLAACIRTGLVGMVIHWDHRRPAPRLTRICAQCADRTEDWNRSRCQQWRLLLECERDFIGSGIALFTGLGFSVIV